MNQLVTTNNDFEWLTKTDINMNNVAEFFGELYDYSFERLEMFDSYPDICDYVPTKFILLDAAFMDFEERLIQSALTGNDSDLMEDIQYWIEQGYTYGDIATMFLQMRTETKGYDIAPEDGQEKMFQRDILKGIDLFNLSYIDDGFEGSISNDCPESIIIKQWVNPPIVRVW